MRLSKYLNDFFSVDNKITWTLSKLVILLPIRLDFVKIHISENVRVGFHRSKWPALLLDKRFKAGEKDFYSTFFKDGDIFVDVGANIGAFTLLAAASLKGSGHVYAIEPNPKVCNYLADNVKLNSLSQVVTIYNVALSDQDGRSQFFLRKYGDDLGSLSKSAHDGQAQIEVETVRGERLFNEQDHITLLKVDVEGAEYKVFQGFADVLATVKFVIFENDPDLYEPFGVNFEAIYDYLVTFGFGIYSFQGSRLSPISRGYTTREHLDLLAVRPRDVADFQARTSK